MEGKAEKASRGGGFEAGREGGRAGPPRASLGTLGVISLGHTLNDLYSNFLPQLLPFLIVLMPGFKASRATALIAAFSISSSLFQPIFGYIVDAKGQAWLVYVGTLWMSVFLSLTGRVQGFLPLLALSALAGLGTAAFHPPASALVHGLSARHKAVYQSTFVAFGNFGFALAPLLLVPLFQAYGLGATSFLLIPGILAAALLFFALPSQGRPGGSVVSLPLVWRAIRKSARELGIILGLTSLRQASYTGFLALLPLYFHEREISKLAGSRILTLMLFCGALGGITGGFISDRWGRKRLIVASLSLATPLFYGFLSLSGTPSLVCLVLAASALMSSFSVTTVAAQEAIPEHRAMAAGLSLGFAHGLGALAVIFIGKMGDVRGLRPALALLAALPLAAALVGLLLKRRPLA